MKALDVLARLAVNKEVSLEDFRLVNELVLAADEFCVRRERGEVVSNYTYRRFLEALGREPK